ncbi:MAG: hypothetical protein ACOCXT_05955 [Candidatus Dojkabacteria bacterium]
MNQVSKNQIYAEEFVLEEALPEDGQVIMTINRNKWLQVYPDKKLKITRKDVMEKFSDFEDRVNRMVQAIHFYEKFRFVKDINRKTGEYRLPSGTLIPTVVMVRQQ